MLGELATQRDLDISANPTKLFVHAGRDEMSHITILGGVRDTGAGNALAPVFARLADKGYRLNIFADSNGAQAVSGAGSGFMEIPDTPDALSITRLGGIQPQVVVMGFSVTDSQRGGSGIELAQTHHAHEVNVPSIWVIDSPSGGTLQRYQQRHAFRNGMFLPTYLCVPNAAAKESELQSAPAFFSPDRIIVTGQPAYDTLAREDTQSIRRNVRGQLGLSNEQKLFVYMGSPLPEISAAGLDAFLQGLQTIGFDDFTLAVRRHPADITSQPVYDALTQNLATHDSRGFTTDEIGAAADCVITVDSSEGTIAAIRNIPSIHILVPDILQERPDIYPEGNAPHIPALEDGTSSIIRNRLEAPKVLQRVLFDRNNRQNQARLRANWALKDGNATERVVNLVTDAAHGIPINPRSPRYSSESATLQVV
jgi:hypothetical protein